MERWVKVKAFWWVLLEGVKFGLRLVGVLFDL
jgi:hypothetical protein